LYIKFKMSSNPKHPNFASYLSPTESSARKNVILDQFNEESNFTSANTFYDDDEMFHEKDYSNHTPSKQHDSNILSSEKIKQYNSANSKIRKTSESHKPQFVITKTSTYEGVNRGNKSVTNMRNSRSGIIETTKLTTTTYSPDAKRAAIIQNTCSHKRKN
jgi:hypothetical protein